MKRLAAPLVILAALAAPALAAKTPTSSAPAAKTAKPVAGLPVKSKEPIEISAAKSLEWNRAKHTYTAHKSAIAKQGVFQVNADTLVAKYTDGPAKPSKDGKTKAGGGTNIYELDADDSVVILNPPYTAYGDHAVYEVPSGHATLTGQNMKVVTETESLTARDRIEYFSQENRMTATGDAVAIKAPDTLKADVLNAYFAKDAQGHMAMNKVTAFGHVVIITDKETVYGDKGVYDIPTQKGVVTGKVKMYQDKNWLEGTRADIDMATGISQLFADNGAGAGRDSEGRVKGVFYPKEQPKKNDDKKADTTATTPAADAPAAETTPVKPKDTTNQ